MESTRITKAVMFDASEGQPPVTDATTAALQTTSMIHDRNRQAKARLLVRGHASADEDDPEQLAPEDVNENETVRGSI